MEKPNKFYRYEYRFDKILDTTVAELNLIVFDLLKETPKGYWIGYGSLLKGKIRSQGHWVSKTSNKKYAYPSDLEALNDLHKRIVQRQYILYSYIQGCDSAKRQVESIQQQLIQKQIQNKP